MYYGLLTNEEKEQVVRALRGPEFDRNASGSLYSRGSTDSYYHRGPSPHYFANGHSSNRVNVTDSVSVAEYMAGYDFNERCGDKKRWD